MGQGEMLSQVVATNLALLYRVFTVEVLSVRGTFNVYLLGGTWYRVEPILSNDFRITYSSRSEALELLYCFGSSTSTA